MRRHRHAIARCGGGIPALTANQLTLQHELLQLLVSKACLKRNFTTTQSSRPGLRAVLGEKMVKEKATYRRGKKELWR